MNMNYEEMMLSELSQEVEMSKRELKERIAKFYNDCKNIMERIEDRVYALEKIRDKREF